MIHAMDELEYFKTHINLAEYAASRGYMLDKRESSRASLVMRHSDGDKIVIATGDDSHGIFFSVKHQANGSILDFVMHRDSVNLGHARQILRNLNSASFPTAPLVFIPKPKPVTHDRAAIMATWHSLRPYEGEYLQSRGLTPATITAFSESIRIEPNHKNVCFKHEDAFGVTGWEVKNRTFTGFSTGGVKSFFVGRVGENPDDAPQRIVMSESALDGMSYYQADPRLGLYLSFAGALSPEQKTLLQKILTKYAGIPVITATDNDGQGDEYAAMIEKIRPDAIRARPPQGKDWNDCIRPNSKLPPQDRR